MRVAWLLIFLPAGLMAGAVACGDDPGVLPADSSINTADRWSGDREAPPDDVKDGGIADRVIADRQAPPDPCDGSVSRVNLRLMAGNISSGNNQNYDDGAGGRIFQALQPDVVMLQEFNYLSRSPADTRTFVDTYFGASFAYFRGDPSNQIPNGVISRYPILGSGNWIDPEVNNRTFAWARIDVPGPVDLWAVSVHLLTTNATARNAEGAALVGFIKANVPPGSYITVGGDFNTDNRTEPLIPTLDEVFYTKGPYPADQNGNELTSGPRSRPYDWLLVDPQLKGRETPVKVKTNTFNTGLVFDTRTYTPLSDLMPPLLGTESVAANMQHMPVIRDFSVVCQ
ncbi:MAG: endonuclease/exonuclease/phosphatase family protein [Polyangiaceae bacterium]|nr:endonuclease/exonuclease/phosphatase family protein [Polyangiaceae bacterium]